jgi:hypothetical protein
MTGKNIVELQANQAIDGAAAFEATFPAHVVDELMLEFDPKHSGPPLVVLSGGAAPKEVHPTPLRGRDGRFAVHFKPGETCTSVRVSMLRGVKGKLIKVKLIGHPV